MDVVDTKVLAELGLKPMQFVGVETKDYEVGVTPTDDPVVKTIRFCNEAVKDIKDAGVGRGQEPPILMGVPTFNGTGLVSIYFWDRHLRLENVSDDDLAQIQQVVTAFNATIKEQTKSVDPN